MKSNITLTELSSLTGKTRQTLYNYMKLFDEGKLDKVPYAFVKVFEMMEDNASHASIKKYCEESFSQSTNNKELDEVIKALKENQDKVDYKKIMDLINGGNKNGK